MPLKKIKMIALVFALAGILVACGSEDTVELTEGQNNMIAEYIAGALLRYDLRYEEELVYASAAEVVPEETEETQNPQPEETEAPTENEVSDSETWEETTPQIDYTDLTTLIGEKGITLSYKSAGLHDSYPKSSDDYFIIEPSLSNQLLVTEYTLKNESKSKKKIDLSSAGIKYSLKIDGTEYKPLLTALPNDLRYLSTTLEAGAEQTVVVIFEVGKKASLNNAGLEISRDNMVVQINPLK